MTIPRLIVFTVCILSIVVMTASCCYDVGATLFAMLHHRPVDEMAPVRDIPLFIVGTGLSYIGAKKATSVIKPDRSPSTPNVKPSVWGGMAGQARLRRAAASPAAPSARSSSGTPSGHPQPCAGRGCGETPALYIRIGPDGSPLHAGAGTRPQRIARSGPEFLLCSRLDRLFRRAQTSGEKGTHPHLPPGDPRRSSAFRPARPPAFFSF